MSAKKEITLIGVPPDELERLRRASSERLDLEDRLNDIEQGLEIWMDAAQNDGWHKHDEALLRWLERGESACVFDIGQRTG